MDLSDGCLDLINMQFLLDETLYRDDRAMTFVFVLIANNALGKHFACYISVMDLNANILLQKEP